MTTPEILSLAPSRDGSKGIPRKNIRLLGGYPLVAYSIAAALQAEAVSRVVVSTDDPEIAEVAQTFGAEVPFMHPAELATDRTTDLPVFQDALNRLAERENYHLDIITHMHATSPFRPKGLIDKAVHMLLEHPETECVRSVVAPEQNPFKMWQIDPLSGCIIPLLTIPGTVEPYNTPRQSLPAVYLQTGHVNTIRSEVILGGSMTGKTILPIIVDERYEVDMDTTADWDRGEWVLGQASFEIIRPEKINERLNKKNIRKMVNETYK